MHPISGGLGQAVTKAVKSQELLFNIEMSPGQALTADRDAVFHVTAGMLGSNATRIPFDELTRVEKVSTLFRMTSVTFTGTVRSFTAVMVKDVADNILPLILAIIKEKNPAVKLVGLMKSTASAEPEEKPVLVMNGPNDLLEVFEDRVCITTKGLVGLINKGLKGTKTIPFRSVTAIQFKKQTFFTAGYIQFSLQGGVESKGGVLSAVKDENTFVFTDNAQAEEIKRYVERRIKELQQPVVVVAAAPATVSADIPSQIRKLAELRDAGILTEEEFLTKKAQLLERM